jgi:hypothetical protein
MVTFKIHTERYTDMLKSSCIYREQKRDREKQRDRRRYKEKVGERVTGRDKAEKVCEKRCSEKQWGEVERERERGNKWKARKIESITSKEAKRNVQRVRKRDKVRGNDKDHCLRSRIAGS